MTPVKKRRYYQYTEKETHSISLKWKALHTSVFILLTISSFVSTYAFESILHIFKNRCILYAKPSFGLKNVEHHTTTEYAPVQDVNLTSPYETNSTIANQRSATNQTDENNAENDTLSTSSDDSTTAAPKPTVEIRDGGYWFRNSTLSGTVTLELRKTIFSSMVMCDIVLFNTLLSMVVAAFFSVLLLICGRGGRGHAMDILPQPWLFVYPVLFITAVMVITAIITANTVVEGLQTFCAEFQEFTGHAKCTPLMNHFSLEHANGDFYVLYTICAGSFYATVVLWISEFVLTLLRVLCVVDFQLNTTTIRSKKHDDVEEDTIHEALVKSYPGLTLDKTASDSNETNNRTYQPKEETTQV